MAADQRGAIGGRQWFRVQVQGQDLAQDSTRQQG